MLLCLQAEREKEKEKEKEIKFVRVILLVLYPFLLVPGLTTNKSYSPAPSFLFAFFSFPLSSLSSSFIFSFFLTAFSLPLALFLSFTLLTFLFPFICHSSFPTFHPGITLVQPTRRHLCKNSAPVKCHNGDRTAMAIPHP